jgi:hypothetical protein
MRPLDASLGGRRVRTDPIDVEFVEGAAESRVAVPAGGGLQVDAEDAGLVTVERERLVEPIEVLGSRVFAASFPGRIPGVFQVSSPVFVD